MLGIVEFARAQKPHASEPAPNTRLNAQVQQAVIEAQHGDASHAMAILNDVLREHPDFVPALKVEGMLWEDTAHATEAAAIYQRALTLSPNDADLLVKVGILKLVHGQIDQSVALLQHSVHLHPEDEESNYYLAQGYHLQGRNDLALASIRRALQAAPNDVPVWQKMGELLCSSGQNAEALEWLKKAQASDPSLPRINFDLAVASFNNMDLDAAAAYATTEAAIRPSDVDDLALLASAEVKLGQWEQAKAVLERVLAVRPDDAGSTAELGHCELELKNYAAATASLQRALQLDPTQIAAHYLLSRTYAAQGDTTDAEHEAALHREMMQHTSLAMSKGEAKQQSALSEQAQAFLNEGNETAAVRLFETTLKGPYITRGSGWMSVGATYLAMGNAQAAERSLRHALEVDSRTHGAHMYLGILALQEGDLEQAQDQLQAELALTPNHPLALGELGEVRYRQGRWADAVDLLSRSKTTAPAQLYMLCDSQFHLGKPQAADLTAETVVAYGKDEPALLQSLMILLQRNGQTELATRLAQHP